MYDVCAIGNALVDIIVTTDDAFLVTHNITKGGMTLVDDALATSLYQKCGPAVEMSSGGSAANTLAGLTSFGGKAAYLGKVGQDQFGEIFTHDLLAQGIQFVTPASADLATGRCLVLVTPDAQRSMNTFLGAAVEFGPEDVDAAVVQNAAITYLEGYLFDKPDARTAFRKAAKIAHAAGRKLSLTLSDVFCVSRHRAEFLDLVQSEVDILFANENEIKALYQTQNLPDALARVRSHAHTAIITRGAQGAVILSGDQTHDIAAHPVSHVVDTTGAGDLYAAGFLFGLTQGRDLAQCAHLGAIAAAEVISHYGPRPQSKLSDLL